MPRYYFDFQNGADVSRDDEGTELSGRKPACEEMRRTLLEIGKEAVPNDGRWKLVGIVRDEKGTVWRGWLSFEAEPTA